MSSPVARPAPAACRGLEPDDEPALLEQPGRRLARGDGVEEQLGPLAVGPGRWRSPSGAGPGRSAGPRRVAPRRPAGWPAPEQGRRLLAECDGRAESARTSAERWPRSRVHVPRVPQHREGRGAAGPVGLSGEAASRELRASDSASSSRRGDADGELRPPVAGQQLSRSRPGDPGVLAARERSAALLRARMKAFERGLTREQLLGWLVPEPGDELVGLFLARVPRDVVDEPCLPVESAQGTAARCAHRNAADAGECTPGATSAIAAHRLLGDALVVDGLRRPSRPSGTGCAGRSAWRE